MTDLPDKEEDENEEVYSKENKEYHLEHDKNSDKILRSRLWYPFPILKLFIPALNVFLLSKVSNESPIR